MSFSYCWLIVLQFQSCCIFAGIRQTIFVARSFYSFSPVLVNFVARTIFERNHLNAQCQRDNLRFRNVEIDITKDDNEKWKIFRKDTMNQVMKSFGPIGVLTDPDNNLDEGNEPGSDLWGLKNLSQFLEYFNSDSTKSFNEFKKTWFQTQMSIYMTLDKSFRTSDCELVAKYSYVSFQTHLQNNVRDYVEAITTEDVTHLYTFAPFDSFLLRALEMKHGKEEATDVTTSDHTA